jgi:hypothetical protein
MGKCGRGTWEHPGRADIAVAGVCSQIASDEGKGKKPGLLKLGYLGESRRVPSSQPCCVGDFNASDI